MHGCLIKRTEITSPFTIMLKKKILMRKTMLNMCSLLYSWSALKRSILIGSLSGPNFPMERFHSRDYRPYWFTETKESICIKIEFNSQRFSLGHQHGRHFFVLGHQHGRRDVM